MVNTNKHEADRTYLFHPFISAFVRFAVSLLAIWLIIDKTHVGARLEANQYYLYAVKLLFVVPFIWPAVYLRQVYEPNNKDSK